MAVVWVDEGNGFERLHTDFGATSTVRPVGAQPTLEISSPVATYPHRRRLAAQRKKLSRVSRASMALGLVAALLLALVFVQSAADDRLARSAQAQLAAQLESADIPTFVHADRALVDLAAVNLLDTPTSSSPTPAPPATRRDADGGAVGRIVIPAADVDAVFVAGVGEEQLKLGPGWMPGTAMPGDLGNSVLSGHRTTYGGPFRGLGKLQPGDEIAVMVPGQDTLTFQVRAVFSVLPDAVQVTFPTDGARLTLTTCHPEGSSAERLIVQAELISGPNAAAALAPEAWKPQR